MFDDLEALRELLRPTGLGKVWDGVVPKTSLPQPLPYRFGVRSDLETEEIAEHDRLDSNPYTHWMPRMGKKDLFAALVCRIDGLRLYLERLVSSADAMHDPWIESPSVVLMEPHALIGRKVVVRPWRGWGDKAPGAGQARTVTENLALWIQIDRYLDNTAGQLVAVLDT